MQVGNIKEINNISFQNNLIKRNNNTQQKAVLKPYADSFVKNSVKSAPAFLFLSGVLTAIDVVSKKSTLKNSLKNNMLKFFVPVLVGSSILLSVIENKEPKQKN